MKAQLPVAYFQVWSKMTGSISKCASSVPRLLEQLPRANEALLRHLFATLHNIQQHSSENHMTPYHLSVCIAPSLLCLPDSDTILELKALTKKVLWPLTFRPWGAEAPLWTQHLQHELWGTSFLMCTPYSRASGVAETFILLDGVREGGRVRRNWVTPVPPRRPNTRLNIREISVSWHDGREARLSFDFHKPNHWGMRDSGQTFPGLASSLRNGDNTKPSVHCWHACPRWLWWEAAPTAPHIRAIQPCGSFTNTPGCQIASAAGEETSKRFQSILEAHKITVLPPAHPQSKPEAASGRAHTKVTDTHTDASLPQNTHMSFCFPSLRHCLT